MDTLFHGICGKPRTPTCSSVAIERAKDSRRPTRDCEDECPSSTSPPSDIGADEEDPAGLYARDDSEAGPDAADFDYGEGYDWSTISAELRSSGVEGVATAESWLDAEICRFREIGGQPAEGPAYDPMSANEEQRWAIALILRTIKAWVEGEGYRRLRLLVAGVAGTGKSFVIHVVTELLRRLLRGRNVARVFCPTGMAAYQVGGLTAHSLFKIPTGASAHKELAPP